MLVTHSAAAVQVPSLPNAQVEVVALHRPEAQAALTPPTHEACRPSFGNGAPGAALVVQVKVLRAQYSAAPQSPSTQQPDALGTQALVLPFADALQKPERHTVAAFEAVHGPAPDSWPHWPSVPQMFVTHCEAMVQTEPLTSAQLLVAGLHAAVVQAALASDVEQTPSCRPSLGNAAPAWPFATQR